MIPLLRPAHIEKSMGHVLAAVTENEVCIGPHIKAFEDRVAVYLKTKHAIAVNSGTSALHLALLVSTVKPGDEVIMPMLSFVASANAVRYVGAHPWFIDINNWGQLSANAVLDFLKNKCRITEDGEFYNNITGRRVSAMMAVHLLGHPIPHINHLASAMKRAGLFVIEDCAQSFGATWEGTKVGRFGDIACFSFNGNKLITCGGGGMVTTNSDSLAREIRSFAAQGKIDNEPYTFFHDRVAYNYRMPNILAAVGCSQFDFLDRIITKKRAIRAMYETYLDIPVLREHEDAFSTYWLNLVWAKGRSGRKIVVQLREKGIEARQMYTPMSLFPMYEDCTDMEECRAYALHNNSFLVPSSVDLDLETVKYICNAIKEIT
jgi:perosamine synthetase